MSKLKFLLPLILVSGAAHALQGAYNIDGYAGLETKIRRMDFKRNFGKNIFDDSKYTSLHSFVGFKLNKYFGVEAGYELSDNNMQAKYIKNGKCLYGFNLSVRSANFDSLMHYFDSRSKIYGFNLNLIGFLPVNDSKSLSVIGTAGLGYLKSQVKYDLFEILGKNIQLNDGYNVPIQRIAHTKSKYKAKKVVMQLNYGIQYLTSSGFGVRALLGWEGTHKIKAQGIDRETGKKVSEYAKFKDSITYRIGFLHTF